MNCVEELFSLIKYLCSKSPLNTNARKHLCMRLMECAEMGPELYAIFKAHPTSYTGLYRTISGRDSFDGLDGDRRFDAIDGITAFVVALYGLGRDMLGLYERDATLKWAYDISLMCPTADISGSVVLEVVPEEKDQDIADMISDSLEQDFLDVYRVNLELYSPLKFD